MSGERPSVGLHLENLFEDKDKRKDERINNAEEKTSINETASILQCLTAEDFGKQRESISDQSAICKESGEDKRTLRSEKHVKKRHQVEQSTTSEKKPRIDTERTERHIALRLPKRGPKRSPNSSLSKTKSVSEEKRQVSAESETTFLGSCPTTSLDVESKVFEQTETGTQSLPTTPEPWQSRQTEKLLESLLKFSHLFDQDDDKDTILHLAIVHNETSLALAVITAMVKRKEENRNGLNLQNRLQQAALHLAVLTCQPSIVRHLAASGADVNTTDRNGQTALHLACKNADVDDVRALRLGVQDWQRKNGSKSERAINVNCKNFEGFCPLHLATFSGSCEVLSELLKMGADVNIKDSSSGRTALHHAVEAHNPVVARFLLNHKADVNAQTFAGNTPLHTASGRHMEVIISLLMKCGANPRLANAEGDLPLPETHRLYSHVKTS